MSALQTWQEAMHHLADGWRHIKERAETALTRFRPESGSNDEALWRLGARWSLMASDLTESANVIEIRLEAPGMSRDDFSIEVHGNEVLISGIKRWQNHDDKTRFHHVECAYGSFERRFTLSSEVDPHETRARYRDGVLTLTLAKKSPQQRRRISVVT